MDDDSGTRPAHEAQSRYSVRQLPLAILLSVSSQRKTRVLKEITQGAVPGPIYYVMEFIAAGIASFGLLADSPILIVGAMLVSPLMAPIFGIALSLTRGDLRLLRSAAIAEFGGFLLIIAVSYLMGLLPFSLEVTPTMLSMTKPSLLDLFIAMLAGFAGGIAMVDERTSPALPGVAIATSLTPPLATCGLSLAFGAYAGAWGAFLLFFANFLAILGVAAAIFIFAGFVTREELGGRMDVVRRFSAAAIGLIAVATILTRQLFVIVEDWRLERNIVATLERSLADSPGARLANIVREKSTTGPLNVLATVNTSRAFAPQEVGSMQEALAKKTERDVHLFVRSAITHDIAAAGSAFLLPTVDLNGRFVATDLTPAARMTEIGEQTLRELVSRYKTFELRGVALIQLPRGPVFVATVEGPRAPTPVQIKYAEDLLRKRLDDSSATLLVRAATLVNSSAKGRILLGEAQFGALSAEDQALQARIETESKTAIERLGNTFVESIDAAPDDRRWNVRAEVISAEPLRPSDVTRIERTISGTAQKPVSLTVLTPAGLIVNAEGFTTVQRAVEAEFARRLAAGVVDDSASPPRGAETIPLPRN